MLPTTQRKTIDYDAIYTGLLDYVNTYSAEDVKRMGTTSIEHQLREFKTIGITAPRQCGKTQWLIKMLNENPDSSAVFYNANVLRFAKNYMVDVSDDRLFTARDVARALHGMREGIEPRFMKSRKVFVDDAFRTIDYIGWKDFYKWLGVMPHAKELVIVNVG